MDTIENAKNEGLEIGKNEGLKIGRQENKIEIAKRMLEENFDLQIISKITGLKEKEIEDLK